MKGAKRAILVSAFRLIVLGSLLSLSCSVAFAESYALGKPISELQLKDGTVLHAFTVVSVSSSSVMAKWQGGRGNIKFSELPDAMSVAFAMLRRPDPSSTIDGEQPGSEGASEGDRNQPPAPIAITGEIGPTDGRVRTIRGQVIVTAHEDVEYKLGDVTIYVFGLKRFYALEAQVHAALKPTYDYFTALHSRAMAQKRYDVAADYSKLSMSFYDSELTLFPTGPRAVTDAEGRFDLRHTLREPYVIVARASRHVGDDVEHYEWMILSTKLSPDGKVLLSNSNMRLR